MGDGSFKSGFGQGAGGVSGRIVALLAIFAAPLALTGCDAGTSAAATAADTVSHSAARDAGVDAHTPPADASPRDPDAGTDAGPRDANVAPTDGGADAGPLPTCIGEGVWRNSEAWCENLANVVSDYDCDLIYRENSGICTWSGTPASVRSLTFVLEYRSTTPFEVRAYACHRPAPTDAYRQTCEVPLRRECEVAETNPDHRDGVDYVPLCAAAADRGVATRILHHSPHTGCPDS